MHFWKRYESLSLRQNSPLKSIDYKIVRRELRRFQGFESKTRWKAATRLDTQRARRHAQAKRHTRGKRQANYPELRLTRARAEESGSIHSIQLL
jgi:hypothetical protein